MTFEQSPYKKNKHEGPTELLLAKVKNGSGRIGIFTLSTFAFFRVG